MITGEIKSKIDQIWNAFWSGGISNPLEVMEQMTYLLFIRRLDEIQITKEKKANRLKTAVEHPIFTPEQDLMCAALAISPSCFGFSIVIFKTFS